ncbi:MAG: Gfo/Idh/MocA family oxidoreductase [Imperialibacter sp.]|uniref:Gfo/Idh/MocA family protein n=1 Tax=Imperialibacter sp. TaxID=2038411 RepID=UPI0032EB4B3D
MIPFNRRTFLKKSAVAGVGFGILANEASARSLFQAKPVRVGIIGLDTSHSVAFTKLLNDPEVVDDLAGYRVVAAYPHGSADIESSVSRIPGYIEDVKKLGVEITSSIKELLDKTDVILLETNDGRLHLEQARQVIKAKKPMFVDKPVAASLKDCVTIYKEAAAAGVPIFSASSLRYMKDANEAREGKLVGKVQGADTYSPAHLEPHHPDFFWYGIHGVESLFTVMGAGCKEVTRTQTPDTDIVVGVWNDNRIGTFRGMRKEKTGYGGTVFGENGIAPVGPYDGYRPLLVEVIKFLKTGKAPVSPEETLEIYAFMEAADESKRRGGSKVTLAEVMDKARG